MILSKKHITLLMLFFCTMLSFSQGTVKGTIYADSEVLPFVNVYVRGTEIGTITDENGGFVLVNVPNGKQRITASFIGYEKSIKTVTIQDNTKNIDFVLENDSSLDEIVITGTLKPVSRLETPVPVEVYTPAFFKKNPTPNIFEAMQNVNGVRPQLNCSVCNTGDIHINGLEGPYTLVLIDGMPIVSGLSTVYGLSGIPNALIERVEIVKGPASSLYGSEAVGGLINIITKKPSSAPLFFTDIFATGWGEVNVDVGMKTNFGKSSVLTGVNYFNYSNPIDNNDDNFTDLTLQDRISVFQKWAFNRKNNRVFTLAGRFFYEDRWGGELNWSKSYRGGDEVYGESIYTKRWELIGSYQLPVKEKMLLNFSYTDHDQNSVYGDIPYLAQQKIGFSQLTWDKTLETHDLLVGMAVRYQYYNDNTTATVEADEIVIPSLFVQDEITLSEKHKVLLGARYDYDKRHGNIFTPRIAYKWNVSKNGILRLNAGTGFRVVNLFTEEHAALTGSREVIIEEALDPEKSYNVNINYMNKIYAKNGTFIGLDISAWYTKFENLILPDYDTNPNEIRYGNLDGHAVTKGISANVDIIFNNGIKALLGGTIMDVTNTEKGITKNQMLTEKVSANWAVSYKIYDWNLNIDYTGNLYGPMRLPLLGDLDPRRAYSPTWSIQNIQFTYDAIKNIEVYVGIKNLLNWTSSKGNPFIIARAHDPFDKDVDRDNDGNVIQDDEKNPYALSFDPAYVYASNQGIRGFAGLRYTFK